MTNHIQNRYTGAVARDYEVKRQYEAKWRREQEVVRRVLAQIISLSGASTLLDVPVGTGRFFPFYKKYGFEVTGVDISNDMLSEAADRASELGMEVELVQDSLERLNFEDDSFDTVLCIRILNWIDFQTLNRIFSEISRITIRNVVVGVRVSEREYNGSISSMLQFAGFWAMAGYRAIKARLRPGQLKIHRESRVLDLFGTYNLTVKSKILVEGSRLYSCYYIYHLVPFESDESVGPIQNESR